MLTINTLHGRQPSVLANLYRIAKRALAGAGLVAASACASQAPAPAAPSLAPLAQALLQEEIPRIEQKANEYLAAEPVTVTAAHSERSAGGRHDFYSEGDYWWPDPDNPEGPYIRRDGHSNPDNFIAHRQALMRFSEIVATLTSAYLITGDSVYAEQAIEHLRAWFISPDTRMNPNLLYSQAIKGRSTGRSIGIIDTIHLTEVARSAQILRQHGQLDAQDDQVITAWFSDYLYWLRTHPYGVKERNHPNNHGICWAMQTAAFADLVGDERHLAEMRSTFKDVFVGEMMAADGSFPAELARTKAYGYSLFVLDAMATLAQIASTDRDNLWQYQTPDGRGMAQAVNFMLPYIRNKQLWPLAPDVLYWDEWPVRHPALVFAALAYGDRSMLDTWQTLEADPTEYEVRRNLPVRHPLLWLSERPLEQPLEQSGDTVGSIDNTNSR